MLRTLRFSFVASSLLWASSNMAQAVDKTVPTPIRGVQYTRVIEGKDSIPYFAGLSIGVDAVGVIRATVSSQGSYEAFLRGNIRQQWFPIAEIGYAVCDHTDASSNLHFKTSAPYFRLGVDYNFNKDRRSGNRVLGGLRLAGTSFQYDLDGPALTDDTWGGTIPYTFSNVKSSAFWAEIVFGLEAKIWKNFHLGWSIRYKRRIFQKETEIGHPWHVPGYGKNDGHTFGATFNLIFDI